MVGFGWEIGKKKLGHPKMEKLQLRGEKKANWPNENECQNKRSSRRQRKMAESERRLRRLGSLKNRKRKGKERGKTSSNKPSRAAEQPGLSLSQEDKIRGENACRGRAWAGWQCPRIVCRFVSWFCCFFLFVLFQLFFFLFKKYI